MTSIVDMRGILKPNSSSPTYASNYINGDRPNGGGGSGTLVSRLNLSGGLPTNGTPGNWGLFAQGGGAISVANDGTYNYLRGVYPSSTDFPSDTTFIYGGYNYAAPQRDVWLQFYARMNAPRHGLKFIKLFGVNNTDYANATYQLDYNGEDNGAMVGVLFGDGTLTTNDAQNTLDFTGDPWQSCGRGIAAGGSQTVKGTNWNPTDWGTGWHKFQLRFTHNTGTTSGNEVNDGQIEVRIDDVLYGKATNIFTRNPINGFFEQVGLFNWSQNRPSGNSFEIHIRDGMTVSTGGWVD